MNDLSARRAEAETELAELEREHGKAILDGTTFAKGDRVRALRNRLSAFASAEGLAVDRQRDTAETQRLAKKAELQSDLAGTWENQKNDWAALNMVACNMRDLVARMRKRDAKICKLTHAITGKPVPAVFGPTQVDRDLGMWIMSELSMAVRPGSQLGGMKLHGGTTIYPEGSDWRAKQDRRQGHHVEPVIDGAQPRPKETGQKRLQIEHKQETAIDVNTSGGNGKA